MRLLVLVHRWLGVGVCALFAMWFASGIVMHYVPFPALTEAERIAGLAPIDASRIRHGVGDALTASNIPDAKRVRLVQRADGPVYVVSGPTRLTALRADDLSNARVTSEGTARALASMHGRRRDLDVQSIASDGVANHDQWTVPNGYDRHRPLYKVALNDPDGTELYVSSTTGEVVLDTTRVERRWNYAGSVVHWIYPTVLRSHWAAWDRTVWTLSLVALVAAVTGAALGVLRLRRPGGGLHTPFRGWHAWHHILGLICMTFVVTWIFSGWLSMDHGRLFSRGQLSEAESAALTPTLDVGRFADANPATLVTAKELEWFAVGQHIYRHARTDADASQPVVPLDAVHAAVKRIAPDCAVPVVIAADDLYPAAASTLSAPVYRAICGDIWFHVDGANGAVIERLDPSRRAYRWAYAGLHTFNIPFLINRPVLRRIVIVSFCLLGFGFSITGTVIGWRRLRRQF